ncbi:FAD binding domain protein [Apiospora sp. TS-2023a]
MTTSSFPAETYRNAAARAQLWSRFQSQVSPACRVQPRSADEIAAVLTVVRESRCRFAVLGGGTAPSAGSSNVEGGVTIDLRRMDAVRVLDAPPKAGGGSSPASDDLSVQVGGGARWADVYRLLELRNMSAVGTRNSLTGVVGSILGGGISFFSQARGWACDNVLEFEVVLANASVVLASEQTNIDLFWALRGGGSNFGIVSRVTIDAFPQPPSPYKFRRWDVGAADRVFQRLHGFAEAMPRDMEMIAVTLAWSSRLPEFVLSERIVMSSQQLREVQTSEKSYEEPQEEPDPSDAASVLEEHSFTRTPLQMAQVMDRLNEEGYFNYFGSITVRSDPLLCQRIAAIFQREARSIVEVAGVKAYIVFNPLTVPTMQRMKKRGANALGLDREEGPLLVINVNMHWTSDQDTRRMRSLMVTLLYQFNKAAKNGGHDHPYVFLNHAFETQKPLLGYGRQALERLHRTRKAVDPDGVFQQLQEAHHRLGLDPPEDTKPTKDEL